MMHTFAKQEDGTGITCPDCGKQDDEALEEVYDAELLHLALQRMEKADLSCAIPAEEVYREFGISIEVLRDQPNDETVAALLEVERIAHDPSVKGCTDLAEMFADMKA